MLNICVCSIPGTLLYKHPREDRYVCNTCIDSFNMKSIEGTKHDQDKPRVELLSRVALEEISKVMAFGANKYQEHNWRKGFKWTRLLGAAIRHVLAYLDGEDKDPESGLSHLAHAGCCIMFLLEHEIKNLGEDDRYKLNNESKT